MFCGFAGALMLVVPHRFTGPAFALVQPQLMAVGAIFFVFGTALAVATAFASNKPLLAALEIVVGLEFLLLAVGFGQAANWPGAARFVVFGVGTIAAPSVLRLTSRRGWAVCDVFALLLGIATAITGVLLVVGAGPSASAGGAPFLGVGVAFCVAGGGLAAVQLTGPRWPALDWATRLAVAASFLAFLVVSPLARQSWLGLMYYAIFGAALLLGPSLSSRLPARQASLAAHLGVAVTLAAVMPLVIVVTVISNRQQDLVAAQTLRSAQTLATVLADDVAGFAQTNRAIVTAIAVTPHLAEMSPADKAQLLREYQLLHSEVFAISIYDASGRSLARGDDLPPVNRAGEPVLENARRSNAPSFETIIGRNSGVPTFIFGAPIQDSNSEFSGIVTISVPSDRWLALLQRASGRDIVYIVGNDGRVLVHPDAAVNGSFADFSRRPSVRALLSGAASAGALAYDNNRGPVFAGYARVPEIGGVVAEQPAEAALAAVYNGREFTLKTLLLIIALAVILGLLVARTLAAPLGALARAAERLASGDSTSPLPHSRIAEVQHLATIFGAMRETLDRQTRERDRAEEANRELLIRELQARTQAETLQELSHFKDELLDNVAHELRTPLASIRAYSELLLTYDVDPATQREFTNIINSESERLTRLLNDVLDLTTIQSGRLQWQMADVDLAALLREAARKHAVLVRDKGLNFEVDVASDLPPVHGDSDRLMQVLDNLLNNATKFTQAGEIALRAWQNDGQVYVSVRDTGVGIPAEDHARVFDKFHQVSHGLTDKPAGTGLGLAISKEIVEHHGGRIGLESELGLGSTFIVALPRAKTTRSTADSPPPSGRRAAAQ